MENIFVQKLKTQTVFDIWTNWLLPSTSSSDSQSGFGEFHFENWMGNSAGWQKKTFLKVFHRLLSTMVWLKKKESRNCVQQSPVDRPKCATPDTHILIVTFATREKKFPQTISPTARFPIKLLLLQFWGVKKVVIKNPLHENNQTIFISTQTECLLHPPLSWLLNDSLNF